MEKIDSISQKKFFFKVQQGKFKVFFCQKAIYKVQWGKFKFFSKNGIFKVSGEKLGIFFRKKAFRKVHWQNLTIFSKTTFTSSNEKKTFCTIREIYLFNLIVAKDRSWRFGQKLELRLLWKLTQILPFSNHFLVTFFPEKRSKRWFQSLSVFGDKRLCLVNRSQTQKYFTRKS